MTKFKCNLTLEDATDIQFTNLAGANTGKIEADGDDLVISMPLGMCSLGMALLMSILAMVLTM